MLILSFKVSKYIPSKMYQLLTDLQWIVMSGVVQMEVDIQRICQLRVFFSRLLFIISSLRNITYLKSTFDFAEGSCNVVKSTRYTAQTFLVTFWILEWLTLVHFIFPRKSFNPHCCNQSHRL